MKDLGSQYLSASAGSGKTFALSCRYCRLVMAGARPEAICALTFTRAATREIFAAVVERLLNHEVESEPGWLTCDQALEVVLDALPRLQISTIDAFSSRVARLFAYELGLSPDFMLYEEGDGAEAKAMLRETVNRALRNTPAASNDELLRLFDVHYEGAATAEALSVRLRNFLETFGEVARTHPDGWGDLSRLGDLPSPCDNREALVQRLRDVPLADVSDAHAKSYLAAVALYHPELDSIREWKARVSPDQAKLDKLRGFAETGAYKYRGKPLELGADGQTAAKALWDDLLARDLRQTADHTADLHRAILALNRAADGLADETGRLTFGALTETLARRLGGKLSVTDESAMYVAYRMDTAVRHLMIDEFQDTSVTQWEVLSSLARELAEGEDSTFFYVGDVKQSIYGWRGGDVSLFGDVRRVPDVPAGAPLVESYRSSPAVIDFINAVFDLSDEDVLTATATAPWQHEALRSWQKTWCPHVAHRKDAGYARCVTLEGKNKDLWMDTLADLIAERWKTLSAKRLRLVVLAFRNSVLVELQKRLRERGVECAIDGAMTVAETPMGRLVRALLRWLADPRATLWGEVLRRIGLAEEPDSALLARWNRQLAEQGYAAWLEGIFADALRENRLSAQDLEGLSAIRQSFEALDVAGAADPTEALELVEGLTIPCSADSGTLSLMTVHHSKGLTFDVVFTVLDGDLSNERAVTCEVGPDWVLEPPALSATAAAVPALQDAALRRRSNRFRDDLCALYVAVTRARFEQIVFAPQKELATPAKRPWLLFHRVSGESKEVPGHEGAAEVYAAGSLDWWQDVADRAPAPPPTEHTPWVRVGEDHAEETELPSERARAASVADLLAEGADAARVFGISEHARLADIAWSDEPPCFPEVFRRPEEPCELWRERTFAVTVREGGKTRRLVGQFDRVHLFPESRRAVVYDFKTSREPVATPAYERQLRDYRAALAALTGFQPEDIRMVLLFTRSGRSVEVTGA